MPLLQKINLFNNKIKKINKNSFNNLDSIEFIQLGYNQLTTISESIFVNLPKLNEINLNNNKIVTIHENAFKNLPQLTYIDLQNNKLSYLSPEIKAKASYDKYLDIFPFNKKPNKNETSPGIFHRIKN